MFTFTFFIFTIWTFALAEVSYEFGSVHSLVRPFTAQYLRNSSSVFSDFLRGFENHKVKKVMMSDFWKKVLMGLEGPKIVQN